MENVLTDPAADALAGVSVERTRSLLAHAERLRDRAEKANRARFARLFRDPRAIDVTISLTDEVMRIRSLSSSAQVLRQAAAQSSIKGFGVIDATGLHLLAAASRVVPGPVINLVHRRVRHLTKNLILSSEAADLARHLERRARDGISLNINVLGEAVLGEHEAAERSARVIEMIRRPDVHYVSVKLSSVVSQIITVDRDATRRRVDERLREIYREAERHDTFINLDMEEYRDLDLTVGAFRNVLDEPEFERLNAGIVLQAYLPESHQALHELIAWSKQRHARTAASIKVRLVKGANLAMERAEAELHGWTPAPYATKSDVDASYARLVDVALRPEHAEAIRIGIASHNLFHVTWALEVAQARGVRHQLDVEMLEGMANAEALALSRSGQHVLFYAPVTRPDDFVSAVAYLVRRLDENTSPENYLRAAFDLGHDPAAFNEQRDRFLASVRERHELSTQSRRHAPLAPVSRTNFENSSSADFTDPAVRETLERELERVRYSAPEQIPLVIAGREVVTDDAEPGSDPSADAETWYRYCVADPALIDEALAGARSAFPAWAARSSDERRDLLYRAAREMESRRFATLAVMARDTGKTVDEGDAEVSEAADFARFYATGARDLEGSRALGVVLVVPPWNFPYSIPAGGICAGLAAGNAVIVKPAPEAVATAWELVNHLWSAGVPRDVLQFVPTRDDDSGRHLVTNPSVDAVVLTGSFDTAVMFTGWRPAMNLLAETSGKNAIVVSACADIDAAVKDLVQSAFANAGQKCSAASLAIVVSDLYEDPSFLAQLRDATTSLAVGPGWALSSAVGPVIRAPEAALSRALHQLDEGETWLVEPAPIDDAGLQWRPGVKLGVRPGSWSHHHEWFGPILAVMVAPDLATAIAWQNQTPFGLTAGISSLSQDECETWIESVEAGNLYVNRAITGAVVNRQPFGGWKRSSVGPTAKAGGLNYVHALRAWDAVDDAEAGVVLAKHWWHETGRRAIDRAGLEVEHNIQRYRRPLKPTVVRVDASLSHAQATLLRALTELAGLDVVFSCATPLDDLYGLVIESADQLVARSSDLGRVRWLSTETAPSVEFLARGVSVDRRPLAQRGDVEMVRWLLEQSVAITNHRYGNVHGGPKPICRGLDEPATSAS